MKYDEANVVIENVLTDDDIFKLNESIQKSNSNSFIESHCQLNNYIDLPQQVIDKFIEKARIVSGNNNLILTEYCHARYENVVSDCGKTFRPSLFPHYDESFLQPRFTLDYQFKSNIDWDIIVEDKVLSLKDNQAATFSGTHQIHWRKPQEFKDGDYIEMVFCHFSDLSLGLNGPEVSSVMRTKAKKYQDTFFNNGGFTNE